MRRYIYIVLFMISGVYAAYLRDIPITVKQPDGTEINCYATGDEYYNWLHDEDGYTIIQSQSDGYYYYAQKDGELLSPSQHKANEVNPGSIGVEKWLKISVRMLKERRDNWFRDTEGRDAPSFGIVNNINIFIRFADEVEFSTPRLYYDNPYNKEDGPSLKHYFKELSYDNLTVNTPHYPVCDLNTNISYQDTLPRAYYMPYNAVTNEIGYEGGDHGDERRIREHTLLKSAIEFVKSEIPDTMIVDSDEDGKVDNTSFLISGNPGGWASLLWPHRWSLYSFAVEINGSIVDAYNFNLAGNPTYFNVGTLCHEFGHSLGAPDLYHYSYDGLVPVDGWDIMENNADPPQYMSAFLKQKYCDWIDCPVIENTGIYTMNPAQSPDNNCYRINSPYSPYNESTGTTEEYFVVEYRKKEGMYEVMTPGGEDAQGLLVYRINTVVGNGNADGPPDELYLYRYNGNIGNGDFSRAPFNQSSGRTKINDSTNPSSLLTDGSPGGLNIRDVGEAGNTIQFTYQNLFLSAEIAEVTDLGDEDGVVNPGDVVTLDVTVENSFPSFDVNNVTGIFSSTDENIQVDSDTISFSDLTVENPESSAEINVTFSPDISLGDVPIMLQLNANFEEDGSGFVYVDEFVFEIEVSLDQAGFPFDTPDQVWSSPAVFDIDGDGNKEIIFGDNSGLLHVLSSTGEEIDNFPFNVGDDIWASPAVADLEGDGDTEIIIGSKNKHLYILNSDGSVQFDYDSDQWLTGTPALGNIDDDDELEIIFGGYSAPAGKLFAINPDGSNVPGFPYEMGEIIQRGVALADFNDNGKVDIVCGTDSSNLWLIYDDLTVAEGFPFEDALGEFRTAPSILNVNDEKIIFAGSKDNNFYAVNSDGTLRFRIETDGDVNTSAGFTITENGVGIFFGSNDGTLYGVDQNGNPLVGWPVELEDKVIGSPAFGDLDGDGTPEVVTATDGAQLHALHLDGSHYKNFPIYEFSPYKSSPAIEDIDEDGNLEILNGSSQNLVIIDVKDAGSIEGLWNIYRGNLNRTGYIELEETMTPGIFSNTIKVVGDSIEYNLVFGFSSFATDGYDEGIDIYAPPAPPPPSFDAAMVWNNDRYYAQILDGPSNSLVEWEIHLQYPENNNITLTWDNTDWSMMGSFRLTDAFDGALGIDIDMTIENNLTLANPAFNVLKLKVTPQSLSIFDENDLLVPEEFRLLQNYPNPFNPVTVITYHLPEESYIRLDIFSVNGTFVRTLVEDVQKPGVHFYRWNGRGKTGNLISAGIYFYRLRSGNYIDVKKMVFIK